MGNRSTNRDYSNNGIFKIGKNIKKNSGDLRKLGATQTSAVILLIISRINLFSR